LNLLAKSANREKRLKIESESPKEGLSYQSSEKLNGPKG